jgi:hypothetical protein
MVEHDWLRQRVDTFAASFDPGYKTLRLCNSVEMNPYSYLFPRMRGKLPMGLDQSNNKGLCTLVMTAFP